MSTLLEPGECVRWQHDGGWKVGKVALKYWAGDFGTYLVVQCPEGLYEVQWSEVERQPLRAEWEGKE